MSSNNSRPGGGKHPNSPRYSDRYGAGHVNPYLGGQPGQSAFIRDMEERQEAARRQSEQEAARRAAEAEHARRETEAQRAAAQRREEEARAAKNAVARQPRTRVTAEPVRGGERRRGRDESRAMRDPNMKERLRQIHQQALKEARDFVRGDAADFDDLDFGEQPADIRLKLSDDNKPMVALESLDSSGKKQVSWVPVVLSEKEMEAFFPAIEPVSESKGSTLQEENMTPAAQTADDGSSQEELILIPIAGADEKESPAVVPAVGMAAAAAAAELLGEKPERNDSDKNDNNKNKDKAPADGGDDISVVIVPPVVSGAGTAAGAGLSALLETLPSIVVEPEDDRPSAPAVAVGFVGGRDNDEDDGGSPQGDRGSEAGNEDAEEAAQAEESQTQETSAADTPVIAYDVPDEEDGDDSQPEQEDGEQETGEESDGEDEGRPEDTNSDEADEPEDTGEETEYTDESGEEPEETDEEQDEPEATDDEESGEEEDQSEDTEDEPDDSVEDENDDAAMIPVMSEDEDQDEDGEKTDEDEDGEETENNREPASRPKHNRRRSRPTDVQIPAELLPAAEEEDEEEEQPITNTLIPDGQADLSDEDMLFRRRQRPEAEALFALPNGAKLPKYIDDDDFVERWLGNEEDDEDMAAQKRLRRRRISAIVGAVGLVLALVGLIAVAKWGIGLLGGLTGSESQKEVYGEFIAPVVMSEVPEFEAWDAIPQEKLLQSAAFSVLMDTDLSSYDRDDTGKFIIPYSNISDALKKLYGAYSLDPAEEEAINIRIRNALLGSDVEDTSEEKAADNNVSSEDAYYVDSEDSFHVPDGLSGPSPQVTDISKRDNTVTLTVEYLEDLETGSGGVLYSRQFVLTLADGGYFVQAIREIEE